MPAVLLFETSTQIADALMAAPAHYCASGSSFLQYRKKGRNPHPPTFRSGFLSTIEIRAELRRLLAGLDGRSRELLMLWLVEDHPAALVARRLGISRVHCYRLKEKALTAMLDDHQEYVESAARPGNRSGNGAGNPLTGNTAGS